MLLFSYGVNSALAQAFAHRRTRPSSIDSVSLRVIDRYSPTRDSLSIHSFLLLHGLNDFKDYIASSVEEIIGSTATPNRSAEYLSLARAMGIKPIYKVDLDGNGRLDLVLLALDKHRDHSEIVAIFDEGQDRYRVTRFDYVNADYSPKMLLPSLVTAGKGTMILIHYPPEAPDTNKRRPIIVLERPRCIRKSCAETLCTDTFIYRPSGLEEIKGGLVEYNAQPTHYTIERIEFRWACGLGSWQKVSLAIDSSGEGAYSLTTGTLDKPKETHRQKYRRQFSRTQYEALSSLINYLNIDSLDLDYSPPYTDACGSRIKVTYDEGKIKDIFSYCHSAPRGLCLLGNVLLQLTRSNHWKKVR